MRQNAFCLITTPVFILMIQYRQNKQSQCSGGSKKEISTTFYNVLLVGSWEVLWQPNQPYPSCYYNDQEQPIASHWFVFFLLPNALSGNSTQLQTRCCQHWSQSHHSICQFMCYCWKLVANCAPARLFFIFDRNQRATFKFHIVPLAWNSFC